ncbi:MAG TPA: glycosyl hydrolase family 18 protein [Syntrophomonadaceae bacterium]|nr:glycosyl hydrolase family 18 protein [Syntrophomonadaceae bacterium]
MKRLFAFFICISIVFGAFGCAGTAKKPLSKTAAKPRPEVIGFYVNGTGQYDSLKSLSAHADVIDEIHPQWYHVKPDGSIEKTVNSQAINVAKQNGIKVIPLVDLVPSQDAILLDQAAQDKAIANLVQEVKANNYSGLDIDFEFFPIAKKKDFTVDRDKLTAFIKKMHAQMGSMGKELQMAVLPHVASAPEEGAVYDYGMLAPYLNKVTLMSYDFKEAHSPPGPVAPFAWVEQNITTAIKQGFRPDQIQLGVATYGYDWPAGQSGGFAIPTTEILKQAEMKGYQVKWNEQYKEPYYSYKDASGISREVWFENEATLKTKIDLVNKYQISGISIWRLGYEDPKFWDAILHAWGKK